MKFKFHRHFLNFELRWPTLKDISETMMGAHYLQTKLAPVKRLRFRQNINFPYGVIITRFVTSSLGFGGQDFRKT